MDRNDDLSPPPLRLENGTSRCSRPDLTDHVPMNLLTSFDILFGGNCLIMKRPQSCLKPCLDTQAVLGYTERLIELFRRFAVISRNRGQLRRFLRLAHF